ncbi:MAG TPA: hypothetical protein VNV66_20865, partial [Pilimelia sp.]|nr:hypothetical protein [Pilimelia sp.]
MSRAITVVGRIVRALLAFAFVMALVAGVPAVLVVTVGWPLPDHWPTWSELATTVTSPASDRMILNLIAIVGWIAWVHFLRDLTIEVLLTAMDIAAARRGQPRPARTPSGGPVRVMAAVLVGAIAGAVLTDLLRAAVTGATGNGADQANAAARTPAVTAAPRPTGNDGDPAHQPATTRTAVTTAPAAAPGGPVARPARVVPPRPVITSTAVHTNSNGHEIPAWARNAPGGCHPVALGDTLWDIAADKLGNPHRWREIYVLNRGEPQANGYALTDPDEIHVDWVLALPART